MAKQINDVRIEMRQRAKNCEVGVSLWARTMFFNKTSFASTERHTDHSTAAAGWIYARGEFRPEESAWWLCERAHQRCKQRWPRR